MKNYHEESTIDVGEDYYHVDIDELFEIGRFSIQNKNYYRMVGGKLSIKDLGDVVRHESAITFAIEIGKEEIAMFFGPTQYLTDFINYTDIPDILLQSKTK